MRNMRIVQTTAKHWSLSNAMPDMLREASCEHMADMDSRAINDQSHPEKHQPICVYVWPGRREGVRAPDVGETPLSEEEIIYFKQEFF